MVKLQKIYEYITHPRNLLKYFKTREDFIKWLDLGSKEDLEYALEAFEKEELYEYCVIIRDKIKHDN